MTERDPNTENYLAEVLQRLCEADQEGLEGIDSKIEQLTELELAELINAGHCADLLHRFYEGEDAAKQSLLGTKAFSKSTTTDGTKDVSVLTGKSKQPGSIGRFEIVESIAKGGFAEIYKAFDASIERFVAIKVPYSHLIDDPSFRARFEREAKAVGTMSHPAIVSVYESGTADGQVFLALEWIPGQNLREFLQADDREITARHAALAINQLAQAVGHAHRRGILHRDLKPANVLLDSRQDAPWYDRLKVTDFGLAKIADTEDVREALTADGMLLGTAAYMSPEQIEGNPCPETDVFALGTILYELLTGSPPFKRESFAATIRSIERDSIPRFEKMKGNRVPSELAAICYKCLEKEPEQRYADATELSAELERYLNGMPIQARPASRFEILKKWARRNPAIAACLAVTISTLLVAVILIGQALQNANRKSVELKKQVGVLQTILEDLDDNQEGVIDREFDLRDRLAKRLVTCADQILELSTDPESFSDLMSSLGKALVALGYKNEARETMDLAISKTKKLGGSHDDLLRLEIQRAFATQSPEKALERWDVIIDDVMESSGVPPEAKVQALYNRAESALFAGNTERSKALYSNAIDQLNSLDLKTLAKNQLKAMATYRLARMAYLAEPGNDALKTYREAFDEFSANFRPGHRHVATANNEMVFAYLQNQRFDEAIELAETNFRQTREEYGLASMHTLLAVDKIMIACCETLQRPKSRNRLDETVKILEDNLPLILKKHGVEEPSIVAMNSNLAHAYGILGQRDKQINTLKRLIGAIERELGQHSIQANTIKAALANAVANQKNE